MYVHKINKSFVMSLDETKKQIEATINLLATHLTDINNLLNVIKSKKTNNHVNHDIVLAKYYYCVKVGKISGIYYSWNDCKKNVIGFPSAIFKKFDNIGDAKIYMNIDNNTNSSRIVTDNDIAQLEKDYDVIHVFTDGAHAKNMTSYAIYFGSNDPRNISKIIKGTNNYAELTAIIESIKKLQHEIKSGKIIIINTDSLYSILCLTNNKKNPNKPNYNIIMNGYNLLEEYNNIKFHKVVAHTDNMDKYSIGNRIVDKMATSIIEQSLNNL